MTGWLCNSGGMKMAEEINLS